MPVDRLTRSDSSGDSEFSQLFSSKSIRDLMYGMLHLSLCLDPTYQDEEVWNYLGLSCPSAFSCKQPYTRRSSSTDLLTAPWFKLNPLVPLASVCPCSPFIRSFDRQGFFRRGCWSQCELKTLFVYEFSVHISVCCGQLIHLGVV